MRNSSEDETQREIFSSLKRFLSFRERTEYEVRTHLQKKGFTPEDIERAITELKEREIINDSRFAQLFVSDSIKLLRKGPVRVRRELESLGLNREKIEGLLGQETVQQEFERVLREEIRKSTKKSGITPDERRKLVNKFLRKGFEYERIRANLNELIES